jgi:hypothetical protein
MNVLIDQRPRDIFAVLLYVVDLYRLIGTLIKERFKDR